MTGTPLRLAAYAGALAVAFAAAFTVGAAADPVVDDPSSARSGTTELHPQEDEMKSHPGSQGATGHTEGVEEATAALPGLAVSAAGYTLVPAATAYSPGSAVPFRCTVTRPDGQPLSSYRETHEKELHLIVVRRDLAGFQHVHPMRDADGTWSVALDLPGGGTYRVFADFTPAQSEESLTLGTDIFVAGEFAPVAVPAPAATDTVDGYTVRLDSDPHAGSETELTFTVTRDGAEVTDLEPYLGAFGHLVSLRTGDLAYLHTHPEQEAHAGDRGGPAVGFATEFPTAGTYRLFLDFQVAGTVHTAEFTIEREAS